MIAVKHSDIPEFLRNGDFYRSLSTEDNEEEIFVPEDSFKFEDSAQNVEEFAQLLRAMLFWGIKSIPIGVIDFCYKQPFAEWGQAAAYALGGKSQAKVLEDLITVFEHKKSTRLFERQNAIEGLHSMDGLIDRAILLHRTEIVEYLATSEGPRRTSTATETASYVGRLDYLQLLQRNDYDWCRITCAAAAAGGHLHCLAYLHEQGCPWNKFTSKSAAMNGHLNCILYCYEKGLPWDVDVCIQAVQKDSQNILQFAHEHGCPWDERITLFAAELGSSRCLQYALQQGCNIHIDSVQQACKNGNVDIVALLREYNAPWDAGACANATECQHLDLLKYLHENGCQWDQRTTNWAAFNGELLTLEYAISNGCPCDDDVLRCAALRGHLDCLQYLVEQSLYMNEDGSVFGAALRQGHYECVEYLIDADYPFKNCEFDDTSRVVDVYYSGSAHDFYRGMVLALERGWQHNDKFTRFVHEREYKACMDYLTSEGYVRFWDGHSPVCLNGQNIDLLNCRFCEPN